MTAPEYPDFPEEEFDLRYRRARQLMAEAGLDALLVTAPANYMYFTGHRSEQMLNDKIRPYVFLLPIDRDPICFVMPFEEGHVRLTTWINDVRTYQLLKHNDVLAESMHDIGLTNKRVGCELGREQYMRFSYHDFNDLRRLLPDVSFVDASKVLLHQRMVKSPAEVERCRTANCVAARVLERAYEHVKPGTTHEEVAALVRRFSIAEGGKTGIPTVFGGYDFSQGKVRIPLPRQLEVGDTLTVDLGTEVKGYFSDVARTAVVGKATQQQKDLYKFTMELNQTCYETIRPGNLCEDVALTCQRELERVGLTPQAHGRIGHGVGCEGAEFPSLAVGEKVQLEPGMVFACNPNFVTEYGFFNMEEVLVVTEDGYELLPDPQSPQELQILA